MRNILMLIEAIAYAVLGSRNSWTTGLKTGAFLLTSLLVTLMLLYFADLCIISRELLAAAVAIVFAVVYQAGVFMIAVRGHKNGWKSQ